MIRRRGSHQTTTQVIIKLQPPKESKYDEGCLWKRVTQCGHQKDFAKEVTFELRSAGRMALTRRKTGRLGSGWVFQTEGTACAKDQWKKSTWWTWGSDREKVRQGTGALGTLGPLRTEKEPRADRAALKTSLKRWVFTWSHYRVLRRWCSKMTLMSWNFPFGCNVENGLEVGPKWVEVDPLGSCCSNPLERSQPSLLEWWPWGR